MQYFQVIWMENEMEDSLVSSYKKLNDNIS